MGLGGAPKNPSHGNSGYRCSLRQNWTLPRQDCVIHILHKSGPDRTVTRSDNTLPLLHSTAPCLYQTRDTWYVTSPWHYVTKVNRNATLPYFTAPLLVVMTLHLDVTKWNCTVTDLYYAATAPNRTIRHHITTLLNFAIPRQDQISPYHDITPLHLTITQRYST